MAAAWMESPWRPVCPASDDTVALSEGAAVEGSQCDQQRCAREGEQDAGLDELERPEAVAREIADEASSAELLEALLKEVVGRWGHR